MNVVGLQKVIKLCKMLKNLVVGSSLSLHNHVHYRLHTI